jgi:carbon-monoxide dehydrogenase catalytic subunit
VILGHPFHTGGSDNVTRYLNQDARELFGASFHVCTDPKEAADKVMEIINRKRERLGINRKAERKLFDMKDRRALDV